ncbi:MAG: SRPBCC family protein [Nocardioides sp.]
MNNGYRESLEIDAPPAAVWAVVSDVTRLPVVLSGMTALEVEGPDSDFRVGLTWTQTRVIAGRTGSERLRITEIEPGRSYVTEGGSHGFDYRTTWAVEEIGEHRARMGCTFEGHPRTTVAKLMLRLFGAAGAKATRKAMRTDLHDIARAAAGLR